MAIEDSFELNRFQKRAETMKEKERFQDARVSRELKRFMTEVVRCQSIL